MKQLSHASTALFIECKVAVSKCDKNYYSADSQSQKRLHLPVLDLFREYIDDGPPRVKTARDSDAVTLPGVLKY